VIYWLSLCVSERCVALVRDKYREVNTSQLVGCLSVCLSTDLPIVSVSRLDPIFYPSETESVSLRTDIICVSVWCLFGVRHREGNPLDSPRAGEERGMKGVLKPDLSQLAPVPLPAPPVPVPGPRVPVPGPRVPVPGPRAPTRSQTF